MLPLLQTSITRKTYVRIQANPTLVVANHLMPLEQKSKRLQTGYDYEARAYSNCLPASCGTDWWGHIDTSTSREVLNHSDSWMWSTRLRVQVQGYALRLYRPSCLTSSVLPPFYVGITLWYSVTVDGNNVWRSTRLISRVHGNTHRLWQILQ